jgi:hypothetical protein
MVTAQKDPSATLEYGFDLSAPPTVVSRPWLAPGESVIDLTVTADAGLTVSGSSINTNASGVAGALLLAWISGGVAGNAYAVHFSFTTNQGRTDCRSLQIQVQSR